ncbi:helix-turn-helix domain-containing protein [Bacillus sp. Marseille-P3661]|uniref:helix-turn-helix domain-containing protein n=1 Tax=Bacillus sp. Marseille-P3661 TaxID=1936234 RepID=UPI000C821A1A|nr:helix-turn-helix domain-containing protein [Bacillus sp. Marseille-P3661]
MVGCFDFSRVGKEIKKLRLSQGLSQKELFHGILSQSGLSKIENGDTNMQAKTLFLIADRLGKDVNYFYQIAATERLEYIDNLITQMNAARKNKDYKKLAKLVKTAKATTLYQATDHYRQYLLWNEALAIYFVDHSYEKSLQLLTQALQVTHKSGTIYHEREIHILASLACIKLDSGERQAAYEIYQHCLSSINKLGILHDVHLKTQLFHSLACAKLEDHKYEDCVYYCELGIHWCVEHESLFLLKDFYALLCKVYEHLGETALAQQFRDGFRLFMNLGSNI